MYEENSSLEFKSLKDSEMPSYFKSVNDNPRSFGFEYMNYENMKDREEVGISSYYTRNLSSLPLTFSDNSALEIFENQIVHNYNEREETCFIGAPMINGVYRITFEKKRYKLRFGVIDASFTQVVSGKSLSDMHFGCEIGMKRINIIQLLLISSLVLLHLIYVYVAIIGAFDLPFLFVLFLIPLLLLFAIFICVMAIMNLICDYYAYNKENKRFGKLKRINEGDLITMEVDLNSKEPKERKLHFFINGTQQKLFFSGLPSSVKFGV